MTDNVGTETVTSNSQEPYSYSSSQSDRNQRLIGIAGLLLLGVSVILFCSIGWVRVREYVSGRTREYATGLEFITGEAPMFLLFAVAGVLSFFGSRLLTSSQIVSSRSIPKEDYPLISKAVVEGKPEPIDQYVKLRSLTGWSGTFTKLGITGLPLTTVMLTLIFSFLSLLPGKEAQFLDLAKLTLGAFIGSFVQRSVEQRKQDVIAAATTAATTSRDETNKVEKDPTKS